MTASFPMYDWPEVRSATDDWWQGLARALRAEGVQNVPDRLQRSGDVEALWSAPDLLISQTCGYPLTHAWAGRLTVVATPQYDAEGCEGLNYCSFLLARRDDARGLEEFRGTIAAYNGTDSQSGYSALRSVIAPLAREGRFFRDSICSGGHLKSMQLVASGEADLCAADAVCWALARRHCADLAGRLRPVGRSDLVPGLPYVTAAAAPRENLNRLRTAVQAAFEDRALGAAREALMLCGHSLTDTSAYQPILDMESASEAQGYASLR